MHVLIFEVRNHLFMYDAEMEKKCFVFILNFLYTSKSQFFVERSNTPTAKKIEHGFNLRN